jgi:ATP-dependent Lon protease
MADAGRMSVLQVEKKIKSRVKSQMERTQREYYLNEQMKAIQRELGDSARTARTRSPSWKRIAETKLSKEAREKAEAELKKLQATCRRCRPRPRWCATISTGCCRSRGA